VSREEVRKQVLNEFELADRDVLNEIFERARSRGLIPSPDEAMRQLREQHAILFPPRGTAKGESLAGRFDKDAIRLHQEAYKHAVRLYNRLVGRAVGVGPGRPPLSAQQIHETVILKEQGKSNAEIAKKLGISRDAVLKRRRTAKRPKSPK
jgi:DNA-binding NarL/FixJ family response regulator